MTMRRWHAPTGNETAVATEVAGVLAAGGVVALPTETYYGLAAGCLHPEALARVSRLKRRPPGMPLLLLVDGPDRARDLVTDLSPLATEIMRHFWPGPLTIVLPAAPGLAADLLSEDATVALRHSSYPLAGAVVGALGEAITGTSANLSGAPPPRRVADIRLSPEAVLDGIVDGGITPGGPPSTLLRVLGERASILRAGAVDSSHLREVLGNRLL